MELNKIKKYTDWRDRWENPDPMGLLDYIDFNIHPEDVLILGKIFFPDVVEVDGYIFLSAYYDPEVYGKIPLENKADRESFEKSMNRSILYDWFGHAPKGVDEAVFEQVGKLLQFAWQNYFNHLFPERKIVVEYANDEADYGPSVTFYQTT